MFATLTWYVRNTWVIRIINARTFIAILRNDKFTQWKSQI